VWLIEYSDIGERAILGLDKPVRERILAFMRTRVAMADDAKVLAEPLTGEFQGLWRYRVGDYRIICDIQVVVRVVECWTQATEAQFTERLEDECHAGMTLQRYW
jgi:mRNA interferase RelE/StbE